MKSQEQKNDEIEHIMPHKKKVLAAIEEVWAAVPAVFHKHGQSSIIRLKTKKPSFDPFIGRLSIPAPERYVLPSGREVYPDMVWRQLAEAIANCENDMLFLKLLELCEETTIPSEPLFADKENYHYFANFYNFDSFQDQLREFGIDIQADQNLWCELLSQLPEHDYFTLVDRGSDKDTEARYVMKIRKDSLGKLERYRGDEQVSFNYLENRDMKLHIDIKTEVWYSNTAESPIGYKYLLRDPIKE